MTYQERRALAKERLGKHAYAMANGLPSPYGCTTPSDPVEMPTAPSVPELADQVLATWPASVSYTHLTLPTILLV